MSFEPDDLTITRIQRRTAAPGTWVGGVLDDYRFEALVFPEHAACEGYELGRSRISKLWLQRLRDRRTVFHWDRGPDLAACDADVQAQVDFLCEGLADLAYLDA